MTPAWSIGSSANDGANLFAAPTLQDQAQEQHPNTILGNHGQPD
jgi:hypothetical protein